MTKVTHDSATPAKGQQVISAVAFIYKFVDGVYQVFLPKRADSKKFLPGLYEMPGGHIDFGEDIVEGLKREIAEELGVSIKIGDPFACFTYMNKVKGSHSIEVVYFGEFLDPEEKITINAEDHSEFKWFSLEDIIANKHYIIPPAENQDTDNSVKGADPEYKAILKGFEILGKNKLQST